MALDIVAPESKRVQGATALVAARYHCLRERTPDSPACHEEGGVLLPL